MDNLEIFEQGFIENPVSGEIELFSDLTHPDCTPDGKGWFYWYCFPGCLPDTEAVGPFDTSEEAATDASDEI